VRADWLEVPERAAFPTSESEADRSAGLVHTLQIPCLVICGHEESSPVSWTARCLKWQAS